MDPVGCHAKTVAVVCRTVSMLQPAAREMYCDALASCGATATLVNNQTTTTAESNCAVSCAAMLAYGFKPDSA